MVFELLTPLVRAVAVAHRDRPDPARDAAERGVLGVESVAEEEREILRKGIDRQPAGQEVLAEGESVCEGEGELADRIRTGLGHVVARDRDRVEVLDPFAAEGLLDVALDLERELGREDAGVLGLVLLQDVRLHRPAHGLQHIPADPLIGLGVDRPIPGNPEQPEPRTVMARRQRPRHNTVSA